MGSGGGVRPGHRERHGDSASIFLRTDATSPAPQLGAPLYLLFFGTMAGLVLAGVVAWRLLDPILSVYRRGGLSVVSGLATVVVDAALHPGPPARRARRARSARGGRACCVSLLLARLVRAARGRVSARLSVVDLGRRPYAEVLELQRALCRQRMAGERREDLLLLVEHEPVVTLGRGTRASSLPLAPAELERRGLEVAEVERGGDVTYHGPGQLVGYPVLDLREHREDLHWYLRQLEAGAHRRARRAGHSGGALAGAHRRVDARAQDRKPRHPREAMGDVPRVRAQRQHGSACVRADRPVRDRRGRDDERGGGARASGSGGALGRDA